MATARASSAARRISTRVRRTSPRQGPRAPMQLVERMQTAVIGVVNAYIDRLMREIAPALRARFDADPIPIGHVGGQVALGHQFLETMFRLVDRQASEDLARVIPVSTSSVLPRAAKLQAQWIENNTELIRLEERARAEIRKVIEGPLREGIRVEEVRARIEERLGVVRSRAEFIARDQTLKLYGQIQQARQTAAGIEEYTWSTSEDERVRPDHAELEGTTQRWDDPPVVDDRTGRKAHPGGDFNCLPGDAQIGFAGAVNGAFRRWYAGELTTLVTASGETLECTPNHPILTAAGWKPAQSVKVGDDVIATREQGAELPEADIQHRQSSIAEAFDALALALGTTGARTVAAQFHGDALADEQVDVVDMDRGLRLDLEAAVAQRLRELPLADADSARAGLRQADLLLGRLALAASCGIGALRLRLAQFLGRCREADLVGDAAIAWLHTISEEEIADGLALDPVPLGQALDRRACSLQLQAFLLGQWLRIVRRSVHPSRRSPAAYGELADRLLMHAQTGTDLAPGQAQRAQLARVIQVGSRVFHGHVFNLSTDQNWYVAAGLVVHNCRCAAIPILPTEGLEEQEPPEPEPVTPPAPEPANEVEPPTAAEALERERERLAQERAAREAEPSPPPPETPRQAVERITPELRAADVSAIPDTPESFIEPRRRAATRAYERLEPEQQRAVDAYTQNQYRAIKALQAGASVEDVAQALLVPPSRVREIEALLEPLRIAQETILRVANPVAERSLYRGLGLSDARLADLLTKDALILGQGTTSTTYDMSTALDFAAGALDLAPDGPDGPKHMVVLEITKLSEAATAMHSTNPNVGENEMLVDGRRFLVKGRRFDRLRDVYLVEIQEAPKADHADAKELSKQERARAILADRTRSRFASDGSDLIFD